MMGFNTRVLVQIFQSDNLNFIFFNCYIVIIAIIVTYSEDETQRIDKADKFTLYFGNRKINVLIYNKCSNKPFPRYTHFHPLPLIDFKTQLRSYFRKTESAHGNRIFFT